MTADFTSRSQKGNERSWRLAPPDKHPRGPRGSQWRREKFLTFLRPNFFLARLHFFPPPVTAPGSPRMPDKGTLKSEHAQRHFPSASSQSPSVNWSAVLTKRQRRQCPAIACFQTVKDQVRLCKLWDQQLLIHIDIKCKPSFTKSPSLVYRPKSKQDAANLKMSKFTKKRKAIHSVRMPYISLLILVFLNRCISVKTGLI